MSSENNLIINVQLDEQKIPQAISWKTQHDPTQKSVKAFMLSLWDERDNISYRMDLWTNKMQKQEMVQFVEQTLMTMADTLEKSINCPLTAETLRLFSKSFSEKAFEELNKQHGVKTRNHL